MGGWLVGLVAVVVVVCVDTELLVLERHTMKYTFCGVEVLCVGCVLLLFQL